MKFIIGIGNPGAEYEGTRHNIGFAVVDALKKAKPGIAAGWVKEKELDAFVAKLGKDTTLVKPALFVNRSGGTVSAIFEKRKPEKKDILIVCDDVNLDFGKLRLRAAGSAGGHHGLESIIENAGFKEFARLRFGIRTARMPQDLTSFVLGLFEPDEKEAAKKIIEKAVLVCESWANEGFGAAMNRLSQLQSIKERE